MAERSQMELRDQVANGEPLSASAMYGCLPVGERAKYASSLNNLLNTLAKFTGDRPAWMTDMAANLEERSARLRALEREMEAELPADDK
ncbi:hypothetical protein ACOKSZ_16760 [Propionibacteriaceae bacterium Y1685]